MGRDTRSLFECRAFAYLPFYISCRTKYICLCEGAPLLVVLVYFRLFLSCLVGVVCISRHVGSVLAAVFGLTGVCLEYPRFPSERHVPGQPKLDYDHCSRFLGFTFLVRFISFATLVLQPDYRLHFCRDPFWFSCFVAVIFDLSLSPLYLDFNLVARYHGT